MIEVRVATTADAEELVRHAELIYEEEGVATTDEWRTRVLANIRSRLDVDLWGWVIDGDDSVAACALLDRHPRLAPPGEDASWRGYVQWVSTDPPYRRRGYSRALMRELMAWAADQGVRVVELHAWPFGRPLYESMGYVEQPRNPMRVDLRAADWRDADRP